MSLQTGKNMAQRSSLALFPRHDDVEYDTLRMFRKFKFILEYFNFERYPNIYDRHTLEWNWTGSYSRVLEDGPHEPLPVQEVNIEVDTSGTWEGGPNTAEVHLSYWLPSNTEEGEKVPVIAVVSAYFDYGSPEANLRQQML